MSSLTLPSIFIYLKKKTLHMRLYVKWTHFIGRFRSRKFCICLQFWLTPHLYFHCHLHAIFKWYSISGDDYPLKMFIKILFPNFRMEKFIFVYKSILKDNKISYCILRLNVAVNFNTTKIFVFYFYRRSLAKKERYSLFNAPNTSKFILSKTADSNLYNKYIYIFFNNQCNYVYFNILVYIS